MNKLLLTGVCLAAISVSGAASAQAFGGGTGHNTLGPQSVITFFANGSITTTLNSLYSINPGPYDGSDDAYIGVINDTNHAINSFGLSSTANIGGFDGDGVGSASYLNNNNSTDTSGYGGADAYFTNNLGTSLTVNFIGGISAKGGEGYFSLESPINLNAPPVVTGVPEASTWAMMLLGFAGIGFAGYRRVRPAIAAA